jgi:hypothetical protein
MPETPNDSHRPLHFRVWDRLNRQWEGPDNIAFDGEGRCWVLFGEQALYNGDAETAQYVPVYETEAPY